MPLLPAGLGVSTKCMTTTDVSQREALHAVVAEAVLAPSIHNTQPWRFMLGRDSLELYTDSTRRLKVLDRTGRQMLLSAGCALFNARAALAASGRAATIVRSPEPDDGGLVARIELSSSAVVDDELAALGGEIQRRQTNRRRFADDVVPDELIASLIGAAEAEGAMLIPVVRAEDRQALARLSQRADAQQLTSAAYRGELRAWTTDDRQRRDGVRAAVVPHVDGSAVDEVPIRDFDTRGTGQLPADTRSTTRQCLLVLGTELDERASWVRAGEALERVWLEITRAGFVASLFTQVIEEPGIRAQLREELRLGMYPHVVLRVGKAPVTAASMRRRVGDVLDERVPGR